MMLIPRFSLRWMLGVVTACCLFFLVLSLAVRGAEWAIALSAAVASLLLVFIAYGAVFMAAWLIARIVSLAQPRPTRDSPFATTAPPPQMVAPEEPPS